MNRILLTLLCVVFVGCATKKRQAKTTPAPMPSLPMPPAIAAKSKSFPVKVVKKRESFELSWVDCEPQPDGTTYRVYETTNFVTWFLYAETALRFIQIPCDSPAAYYGVAAYCDGIESEKAGRECAEKNPAP